MINPSATQPICDRITNSTDMISFHALLDNQRFVLGSTLSIDPVGVSAQEPASVSGPGAWWGASGPMPAEQSGGACALSAALVDLTSAKGDASA